MLAGSRKFEASPNGHPASSSVHLEGSDPSSQASETVTGPAMRSEAVGVALGKLGLCRGTPTECIVYNPKWSFVIWLAVGIQGFHCSEDIIKRHVIRNEIAHVVPLVLDLGSNIQTLSNTALLLEYVLEIWMAISPKSQFNSNQGRVLLGTCQEN